jgi:hypothetical protein
MNQTIDSINTIIQELVDPTVRLTDTLLKVQVLAFKIKNSKLKSWVDSELNGYNSTLEVPSYRQVTTMVIGNLEQERFGGMLRRSRQPLPVEYLDKDIYDSLKEAKIQNSVSELELMVKGDGTCQIPIPYAISTKFNVVFGNEWVVNTAWREISHTSLEGILGSIKSKLLTFVLELAEEIGEKENVNIMDKKKIDNLFDKTIGNVSGGTVNISIGSESMQTINTGENAVLSITKGKKIKQKNHVEVQHDLSRFINEMKSEMDKLSLEIEDQKDVLLEISRIESQLSREKPKYEIINSALKVIHGILIGVTGNALTPIILEKTQWFLSQFS